MIYLLYFSREPMCSKSACCREFSYVPFGRQLLYQKSLENKFFVKKEEEQQRKHLIKKI